MLVAVTISTVSATTTMTAYAAEHSDRSDEIKDTIKAKNDDGRQAIADTDCNPGDTSGVVFGDINQAQDCDALAANRDNIQQEITDGEEPPPDESATLSVCKEVDDQAGGVVFPFDFEITVTGNNPSPAEFVGDEDCVDVTIGPGEYTVDETFSGTGFEVTTTVQGDCDPGDPDVLPATGEIQSGEHQTCTLINTVTAA
jgi:hypothetical protein